MTELLQSRRGGRRLEGTTPTPPGSRRRAPKVTVSDHGAVSFHDAAHKLLMRTIQDYIRLDGGKIDNTRWQYVKSRNGVTVFKDRRPLNATLTTLLGAGTLNARFSDVMDGLYADTAEDSRLLQSMLNSRFVDSEILQTFERRTPHDPFAFTGIKWAMIQAPAARLKAHRDICYYEKLGTISIAENRKLGYLLWHSVDSPECPAAARSGVVRTQVSMCFLMEELREDLVGIYFLGSIESRASSFFNRISTSRFAEIVLSITRTVEISRGKRYAKLLAKRAQCNQVPRSKICHICHTPPSFFDHHYACPGCSNLSVCKKCRIKCNVFRREPESTKRLWRVEFCYECVRRVENEPGPVPVPIKLAASEQRPVADTPDGLASSFGTAASTSEEEDEQGDKTATESGRSLSAFTEATESSRSLSEFTLKVSSQLEDMGYHQTNLSSRISGLSLLGTGDRKGFVFCEESEDEEGLEEGDEDGVIEIQPLRRSEQPPELLESRRGGDAARHKQLYALCTPTGMKSSMSASSSSFCMGAGEMQRPSFTTGASAMAPPPSLSASRLGSSLASDRGSRQDLFERLLQVSSQAEQTLRVTREQAKTAKQLLGRSRVGGGAQQARQS